MLYYIKKETSLPFLLTPLPSSTNNHHVLILPSGLVAVPVIYFVILTGNVSTDQSSIPLGTCAPPLSVI